MRFDFDNINNTPVMNNEKYNYFDFKVTDLNYIDSDNEVNERYSCEDGHIGAAPALLVDGSTYNPNNGRFDRSGIVVYVCPTCYKPVELDYN